MWTRKTIAEQRDRLNLPTWTAVVVPSGVLQFQHQNSTHWLVINVAPSGQVVMRAWDVEYDDADD